MKLPAPLRPLWRGWMAIGRALGVVMSSMLLTVLWVAVFGLYALMLRCIGLFRKNRSSKTYWIPAADLTHDFEHQF